MVGVDKKSYLEKLCRFAAARRHEVLLFNVGDMMYAEAPDIPAGRILDIGIKRLSSLRRSAFKDIIARAPQAENVIVNTHATFRWRHGLFPAVDFDQMRRLDADIYVNLIDGVVALHKRLTSEHGIEHCLKDLIVWREEEIIGTEMLRKGVNEKSPFYCLARGTGGDTVETFYKLLFAPKTKKVYLSFPMTQIAPLTEAKKQIDMFRRKMKKFFTCFDPGDLEESYLPHYAHKAAEEGRYHVEVETQGAKIRLDLNQVLQIERDINSQIYARDFMLIDQSDMIISFIPEMSDGRPAISSGVERELQHAHEGGKEVYVVWQSQKAPSVFVTQTAAKVFADVKTLVGFFKDKGYIKER